MMNRRTFLRSGAAGVLTGIAGLGYSTLIEPALLSLEHVKARIARLPAGLEGLKIAVLSDFHLHPFTKLPLIEEAIELANSFQPDLTVLLGDYVDATVEAIDELAPALSKLNARHGVFGVLGNHDCWKGAKRVRDALEMAGIRMLINQGAGLLIGRQELFLAGMNSMWDRRGDLKSALESRRAGTPTVLLVHEPDFADHLCADHEIALQLSGHSHGGQVRLPLIGALSLPNWGRRYDHGLYHFGERLLYTNRGLGLADLPVRFNCPPEVTEIVLCAA